MPPGWNFYPDDDGRRSKNKRTLKVAGSLLALLLVGSCVAGLAAEDGTGGGVGENQPASADATEPTSSPTPDEATAQRLADEKAAADKATADQAAAAEAERVAAAEAARVEAERVAAEQAAAEAARVEAERVAAAAAAAEAARVEAERVAAAAAAAEAARVEAERVAAEQAAAAAEAARRAASASVTYTNCTAVRAAGAAPIYAGEPGYSTKLDRDRDGIACDT